MSTSLVKVSDFSRYPYGRYRPDGRYSGEAFREDVLLPVFRSGTGIVRVNLDGTRGYGSSFLEESFGGLVRAGIGRDELHRRLKIETAEDPSWIDEIWGYIADASPSGGLRAVG